MYKRQPQACPTNAPYAYGKIKTDGSGLVRTEAVSTALTRKPITISADENDSYSKIITEMRERNKAQTAEQAQTAGKIDESP